MLVARILGDVADWQHTDSEGCLFVIPALLVDVLSFMHGVGLKFSRKQVLVAMDAAAGEGDLNQVGLYTLFLFVCLFAWAMNLCRGCVCNDGSGGSS